MSPTHVRVSAPRIEAAAAVLRRELPPGVFNESMRVRWAEMVLKAADEAERGIAQSLADALRGTCVSVHFLAGHSTAFVDCRAFNCKEAREALRAFDAGTEPQPEKG